jgi:uncharacterized damage-inducible protein DinB
MHQESSLITSCIILLEDGMRLLERLDDEVYAKTSVLSPRASVGAHLRHCLDFYKTFLSGLESGRIDYNCRQRHSLIETDRRYAIQEIHQLIAELRERLSIFRIAPILITTEDDSSRESWCGSSVVRELEFLRSHTIHHYSLMAILLRFEGIEPGEEFGVAPSTLRHWQEEAACAQ